MIFSSQVTSRVARRDRAGAFQEQPVGDAQHVRLVHDRDMPAPLHREAERFLGDAHRGVARDLAHRERQVGGRHELARSLEHVAVGIEPLGVLAHHHEIDRLAAARRKPFACLRGPDVGEQVEPLAQRARRVDAALVGGRIVVVRDRPEDDAVGGLRGREARFGKRRALRLERLEPDRHVLERELDLPAFSGGAQHVEGRGGDLRPDAVALHDAKAERGGVGKGHCSLTCVPGAAREARGDPVILVPRTQLSAGALIAVSARAAPRAG